MSARSPDDLQTLIPYVRGKFEDERYPLAPALRRVRETPAKLDPVQAPEPPAPRKPYVLSVLMQRKNKRRAIR